MMQASSCEIKGNLLEDEFKRGLGNNILMNERLLLSHNQENMRNT